VPEFTSVNSLAILAAVFAHSHRHNTMGAGASAVPPLTPTAKTGKSSTSPSPQNLLKPSPTHRITHLASRLTSLPSGKSPHKRVPTLYESSRTDNLISVSSNADGKISVTYEIVDGNGDENNVGPAGEGESDMNSNGNPPLLEDDDYAESSPTNNGISSRDKNVSSFISLGRGFPPTGERKTMNIPLVNGKFLFLGLENAGKTTLIYQMKQVGLGVNRRLNESGIGRSTSGVGGPSSAGNVNLAPDAFRGRNSANTSANGVPDDENEAQPPTMISPCPPPSTDIQHHRCLAKGHAIILRDQPGRPAFRHLWYEDLGEVRCVIFVIDTSDYRKFPIVKSELMKIGADKSLENMPILVLGNKVDLPNSIKDEHELEDALSLGRYLRNGRRMWTLRMCWSGDMEGE